MSIGQKGFDENHNKMHCSEKTVGVPYALYDVNRYLFFMQAWYIKD